MVRNGRCTELLNQKVSKEECCASDNVATAWSPEDLDAGSLFFWRVLGGGVSCYACKGACQLPLCLIHVAAASGHRDTSRCFYWNLTQVSVSSKMRVFFNMRCYIVRDISNLPT